MDTLELLQKSVVLTIRFGWRISFLCFGKVFNKCPKDF